MHILTSKSLKSNRKIKINFDGGSLSSDAGALLLKEFIYKAGFDKTLKRIFKTSDSAKKRIHKDTDNLMQMLYQIICGYFEDHSADELALDPIFTTILDKKRLASQPTLSRFFHRMDQNTLEQFDLIQRELRKIIYTMKRPEIILLDLDSILLDTYGKQEGESFNFHYQNHGYHPLVCYDGMTGDLLKIELRNGSVYSCTGVTDFLQPLFDEFLQDYKNTSLVLRADSGFATPALYKQCETHATSYAIRLKKNGILRNLAAYEEELLSEKTQTDQVNYAVVYGDFHYQSSSWEYPRRVVFKIEKPANQFIHRYTFIVTNMEGCAEDVIRFYCKRGGMENFIKESKNGFDFTAVSSRQKIVNANRVQLHPLAYNVFNWFKRLVLPKHMQKYTVDTIRVKLLKIATKIIHSARSITFKLSSSYPYKNEFYQTLENIQRLEPKLE